MKLKKEKYSKKELIELVKKIDIEKELSEKPVIKTELITDPEEARRLLDSLEDKVFEFREIVSKKKELGKIPDKTQYQVWEFEGYNSIVEILRVLNTFEKGGRNPMFLPDVNEIIMYLEGALGTFKGIKQFLRRASK